MEQAEFLPEFQMGANESELLEKIQFRVEQLLQEDSGLLFSYLYRMDVEEHILQDIIKQNGPSELPLALAKEILNRQIVRAQIKKNTPVKPISEPGWNY